MLRITEGTTDGNGWVLRLEGELIGPWVSELSRLCEEEISRGRNLKIDMSLVSFADRHGISLLKGLKSRGTDVVNSSPFLREQLNED